MTHLSIDGHLDCFHFFTTLKNAAMSMQCKYLFQALLSISLNQYPEIGLLLDHMIFYFNVFRNCHSVFHSSCTILHSYQQCTRVPPPPHSNQGLLFYGFFLFLKIVAILMDVKWYLMVLIYISLMMTEFEHLSKCLLAICISLGNCLFEFFAQS